MIARLIALCAEHRWLTLLLSLAAGLWGAHAIRSSPLDAIPDLSDVQVIVFTEWMGRGPDLVEDQVTTPLTTELLSTPGVHAVRGQSMFGMSFVYVIFEDGTDLYAARSRVLESLSGVQARLPVGVVPTLGPDATGVGWVYQYALVDRTGRHDGQALRQYQDWTLRFALESVPGVAEVASVGGFVKQLQVEVDPQRLLAHDVGLDRVTAAVQAANLEVGGRVLEIAGHEHVVRGHGYATSPEDLALAPLGLGRSAPSTPPMGSAQAMPGAEAAGGGMGGMGGMGAPAEVEAPTTPLTGAGLPRRSGTEAGLSLRVGDVAHVGWGPAQRRGVADFGGEGDAVGGIVVMRQGENALRVIEAVKARLADTRLPEGAELVPVYDRSELIEESIATLRHTLIEELVVVSLVIVLFLLHLRSALVPILALPLAVLAAFVPMAWQGMTANIMSLGGIAVAIGAMVDASILLVENVHKRLEQHPEDRGKAMVEAMQEVGPSAFFALLVITVSFLPIFALEGTEGRLFGPLAWTKTWAMAFAALFAVTLTPALVMIFVRGHILSEEKNPLSRLLVWLYSPVVRVVVRLRWAVIALAGLAVVSTLPVLGRLSSEFMPPLHEGVILYMPTAPPGISEGEAQRVLTAMDRLLVQVPEVATVYGKMGRAESATDPAPLSMAETVITLKPREEWREGLDWDGLIAELDAKLRVPGFPNAWWMPIQTRTEMLSTGIRSQLGVKVFGDRLEDIEAAAIQVEALLKKEPGTRSAVAERASGGLYLDVDVDRVEAGRHGLSVAQVLDWVSTGIGGMEVGQTVEGRTRIPIAVRLAREYRDHPDALGALVLPTPSGHQVALAQVAKLSFATGPDMLRSEGGKLVGYVFVDTGEVPVADYVDRARPKVEALHFPDGVRVEWAGQFQHLERAKETLALVLPLTLFLVGLLLWFNTRSAGETAIVLLAVPFSLVGAVWLLWALDYHLSVAVAVGLIALAGLDAETGVVMLLYLRLAWEGHGRPTGGKALEDAIVDGAARRVRPKLMTVLCAMIGLLPLLWSDGAGADTMKRIAAPMVGGLATSFLLELLVYPAIYAVWKRRG